MENWVKTSAGAFEDLTRESFTFLASPLSKSTSIRLQKIVTTPSHADPHSSDSDNTTPSHVDSHSRCSDNTTPSHTDSQSRCVDNSPVSNSSPHNTEISPTQPHDVIERSEVGTPLHLEDGSLCAENTVQQCNTELILSNRSSPLLSNRMSPVMINESRRKLSNALFKTCDHEELLEKISTVQLLVEDLKESSPHRLDDVDGKVSTNDIVNADDLLQNMLIAEKMRNKDRIRKREEEKEEKKLQKSPEVLHMKNLSNDEEAYHTNGEDKSSNPEKQGRGTLPKKKDMWRKYPRKNKYHSSNKSTATDVSVLSEDDGDRLLSSDTAETLSAPNHHHGSLVETNLYKTPQSGDAGYPFPYTVGNNFDRVPPLQPYPPYSNTLFTRAPLHAHNNLIFNQAPVQMSCGDFHLQQPRQVLNNNPTNSLNHSLSNNNIGANHTVTLPEVKNLISKANSDDDSTILPSGRGKAREGERILKKTDLEKLEKAQELAMAKLNAFLDQANREVLMDSLTLNES